MKTDATLEMEYVFYVLFFMILERKKHIYLFVQIGYKWISMVNL